MATTNYKLNTARSYKIIEVYDNDNGNKVKNDTATDYTGARDDLNGWRVIVGLTDTDGHTIDTDTLVEIKQGETATFDSGKGAGRNIIVLERQENRTTYATRFDVIALADS